MTSITAVRFEILKAVPTKITIFWYVTLSTLIAVPSSISQKPTASMIRWLNDYCYPLAYWCQEDESRSLLRNVRQLPTYLPTYLSIHPSNQPTTWSRSACEPLQFRSYARFSPNLPYTKGLLVFYKSPPIVTILRHIIDLHAIQSYFFQILFNNILWHRPLSPFPNETLHATLPSPAPYVLHAILIAFFLLHQQKHSGGQHKTQSSLLRTFLQSRVTFSF